MKGACSMGALVKLAAKVGWAAIKKYYGEIMRLIGEGWTIKQLKDWLKRH